MRERLKVHSADAITTEMLAEDAGVSRATFYRCYPGGTHGVLMALYDAFDQRARERLQVDLPRARELGDWLDEIVETVLRDALEMGPVLRALYREELRQGSDAEERHARRLEEQSNTIERWWEAAVRVPAHEGVVEACLLLLQGAALRVAHGQEEEDLKRLKSGVKFLIGCGLERYNTVQVAFEVPAITPTEPPSR